MKHERWAEVWEWECPVPGCETHEIGPTKDAVDENVAAHFIDHTKQDLIEALIVVGGWNVERKTPTKGRT